MLKELAAIAALLATVIVQFLYIVYRKIVLMKKVNITVIFKKDKKRIWNTVGCWLTSVPVKTMVQDLLLELISELKQDKEVIRSSWFDHLW